MQQGEGGAATAGALHGIRNQRLQIRVNNRELERFMVAAERDGSTLAGWVRRALLRAARNAKPRV